MPFETRVLFRSLKLPFLLIFLTSLFFIRAQAAVSFSYTVHLDAEDTVSYEKFKSIPFQSGKDLRLGFYKGSIWIHAKLGNTGQRTSMILHTEDYFNRKYQFFEIMGDSLRRIPKVNPTARQSDDRYFFFRAPNFRVDLEPSESKEFLIHILSDGRMVFASPDVMPLDDFISLMRQTTIFNVSFFGLVFAIFLINLVLSLVNRARIYLLYAASIFFNTYFMLGLDGSLYDMGLDNYVIDHLIFISIRLWVICFLLFSARFLWIKETAPRFYAGAKALVILVFGGLTVYQLTWYHTSISVLHQLENLIGFSWFIILGIGVVLAPKAKRVERKGYIFVLALFILFNLAGLVFSHGANSLVSPSTLYKMGSLLDFIGFTLMMVVFTGKGKKLEAKQLKSLKDSNVEANMRLESSKQRLNDLESRIKELDSQQAESPVTGSSFAHTNQLAIFKLLESNLTDEEDWIHFRNEYLKLDPLFLEKVFQESLNLSKSEIRLLILLKIGYTHKEIAQLLAISPESVKKARQRTRQKLGLSSQDSLSDFLNA